MLDSALLEKDCSQKTGDYWRKSFQGVEDDDSSTLRAILGTGFCHRSLLDEGWYGVWTKKGISPAKDLFNFGDFHEMFCYIHHFPPESRKDIELLLEVKSGCVFISKQGIYFSKLEHCLILKIYFKHAIKQLVIGLMWGVIQQHISHIIHQWSKK